jgi:hypothetical protein
MTGITIINQVINPRCKLLAQVASGYYVVNVYTWGNQVKSVKGNGYVLDVRDGLVYDRLSRVFPAGDEDRSRKIAGLIIKARDAAEHFG